MSRTDDKRKKSEEEFENILDILEPHRKSKFESELADIFEDMKKSGDLGAAIELMIAECNELTEIQSKLVLLIQEHLKNKKKMLSPEKLAKIEADEKRIVRDIEELSRKLLKKIDIELDPSLGEISRKDRAHILNLEAKNNIKRLIKNFAIYEVYKIMNPKRIAGETAKENYVHNLIEYGENVASKYEGGRESDLKRYGPAEVARLKRQAATFKKGGGGIGRGGGIGF